MTESEEPGKRGMGKREGKLREPQSAKSGSPLFSVFPFTRSPFPHLVPGYRSRF
jgi:hypothetical protein